MCKLNAMIQSDAKRFNISVEQLNQLHVEYHNVNGKTPPNDLIDLLEVLT